MDVKVRYEQIMSQLGWDPRDGQRELIEIGMESGVHLVKAPTATGKSLAALITAGLRVEQGERVVIATYTKLLQNQYRDKDLDRAKDMFPGVVFSVLKGANNYVCSVKAKGSLDGGGIAPMYRDGIERVMDMAELEVTPGMAMIRRWIAPDDAEECEGHSEDECGFAASKAIAKKADVVITNHALVMVNGIYNPAVLGEHNLLIVDEIHNAPRAAESFDSVKIDMDRLSLAVQLVDDGLWVPNVEQMRQWVEPSKQERTVSVMELQKIIALWKPIPKIPLASKTAPKPERDRARKARKLQSHMGEWIGAAVTAAREGRAAADKFASVEAVWTGGKKKRIVLLLSTVDISTITAKALKTDLIVSTTQEDKTFSRDILMMSASTGTLKHPTYVADRCGVDAKFHTVESVLNYPEQMQVSVIKSDIPWAEKVAELVTQTSGRTLVLMRSWRMVEKISEELAGLVPYAVHVQDRTGSGIANGVTLDAFKQDTSSVLVGTASFFEGIDCPGETLSQVIIGELPYVFPFSPIEAERKRRVGTERTWLEKVQIPHTALIVEQMIGRLIRDPADRGLAVILDDTAQFGKGAAAVQDALTAFGINGAVSRDKALTWFNAG